MNQDTRATRHFAAELDDVRQRLLAMGRLVEERIQLAIHALLDRDANRAQTVIDHDREINEFQVEIDNRCLTMCALHQPVAVDLRSLIAAMKIASDLERVGDLAVNIAEATKRYLKQPPVKTLVSIERMATLAGAMLHDALDSFVSHSVNTAQGVLDRDDELDDLKMKTFREYLDLMLDDPRMTEPAINLILVSRHLERVGDHATNIAEDVIFIVTARDLRHVAGSRG
ncbi:MAG TPA: phosphate signaling complex protein PhoU [Vicinamibacterales bacterium]